MHRPTASTTPGTVRPPVKTSAGATVAAGTNAIEAVSPFVSATLRYSPARPWPWRMIVIDIVPVA